MASAPIRTWKDLLLPNDQDTRVILSQVTEGQETAKTSSFSLPAWDPGRLPSSAHLSEDLPSKMQKHLGVIVDQHFSDQASKTFMNRRFIRVTPDDVLGGLRDRCTDWTFNLSHEAATRSIADYLSYVVKVIYEALTGKILDLLVQQYTIDSSVITDRVFRFDDRVKILWGNKSSRAFDRFIGELVEQMRDGSPLDLCIEPVATTYRGYKAILGKVRVCPCQTSAI